jgi:Aspartyl protease/PDZ domain
LKIQNRNLQCCIAVAAIVLAFTGTGRADAQSSAAAVLEANRAATSFPQQGNITLTFVFAGFGLTGSATRIIDAATGAYVEDSTAAPVSLGSGYDMNVPWMKDFSGAYTPQEGGDRRELAVNQAYRFGNLWWKPNFGGAKVVYSGTDTIEGTPTDHIRVTPPGGTAFDAWFGTGSHQLVKVSEIQGFAPVSFLYSDYALINSLMLPRVTTIDYGGGQAVTLTLQHATLTPARPLSEFSRPTTPLTDADIEGNAPSTTVAFRLLNNHIYVPVLINGRGPYTFIVDTGGHLALSPHLAAELGAQSAGHATSSGAGEKTTSSAFAHVNEIALGKARLRDQTALVINVYDTSVEGIPVDGMLGFELFRRFGVQIDYSGQTLTIFDPTSHSYADAGIMIPFEFYDHLPDVAGTIAGTPARFDIDTGSRSELDITAPFVKSAALHAKSPNATQAVTGWGVGGPVTSTVTRIPYLALGSVRVNDPIAELSDDTNGSFSDANYDGNIGSGLLKRFIVTFDYAQQRLYLKPAQPTPDDVGTFDRSGMWLNASPAGFVVTALDRNGPAAQAGLQVGDIVLSIDGKPPQMADLSEVRTRLRTLPSGTSIHFNITRAEHHQTIEVTLQNLVSPPAPRE